MCTQKQTKKTHCKNLYCIFPRMWCWTAPAAVWPASPSLWPTSTSSPRVCTAARPRRTGHFTRSSSESTWLSWVRSVSFFLLLFRIFSHKTGSNLCICIRGLSDTNRFSLKNVEFVGNYLKYGRRTIYSIFLNKIFQFSSYVQILHVLATLVSFLISPNKVFTSPPSVNWTRIKSSLSDIFACKVFSMSHPSVFLAYGRAAKGVLV